MHICLCVFVFVFVYVCASAFACASVCAREPRFQRKAHPVICKKTESGSGNKNAHRTTCTRACRSPPHPPTSMLILQVRLRVERKWAFFLPAQNHSRHVASTTLNMGVQGQQEIALDGRWAFLFPEPDSVFLQITGCAHLDTKANLHHARGKIDDN